ncbi:putative alcohol acetyltransferase [Scheffersomyces amazonensis]|uniref:putative alcohol acetyltransferase n=1 Tax=Scheffersomyces amazonensis TaxID=1078765 RepID=UPI00315CFBB1
MVLDRHTRGTTYYENNYIVRNVESMYHNFNVTAQYNIKLTPQILSHGVRNLILNNPIFTVNYFKGNDPNPLIFDYTVKPIEKIQYNDIVEFETINHEFNEQTLKSLNLKRFKLNDQNILWKLYIYEFKDIQYVSFCCDHVLFDANGASAFHEDLLKEISNLKNKSLDILDEIFNYENDKNDLASLPETTDKLTNLFSILYSWTNLQIWSDLLPNYITNFFYKNFHNIDFEKIQLFTNKMIQRRTDVNYRMVTLTNNESRNLLKKLRERNTTFTPYFSAIVCELLQLKVFPYIDGEKLIKLTVVVSGRRYYPELKNQLKYNFCVSSCWMYIKPFKKLFDTITNIGNNLKYDITTRKPFQYVGLLNYIDIPKLILGRIGSYERSTIEVSNIGSFNFETNDGLKISELWFSQDIGHSGHFVFSITSTSTGSLHMVVSSLVDCEDIYNPNTNVKVMDEFSTALKSRLLHAIDDEL